MAERLTDEQVEDLLVILRKDVTVDTKVQAVTVVKSAIKQHTVPDTCVPMLFEALRLASSSPHSALINAGFTALNHLLTRLSRQEPRYIAKEAKHTAPLIVEKMGDPKDKLRALAIQAMGTMYSASPNDAERFVRNVAMVGKSTRAKESSMQWLLQMHKESGLQFRSYVPTLMELLEDADGTIRDAAKMTVIELFRDAPNAAKTDLKKQLKNFKVRPAIESAIVKELAPSAASRIEPQTRPDSAPLVRPNLAASAASSFAERPNTPLPEAKAESVEPSYVNTKSELDDMFRDMHMFFDGRESEHNWLKREESVTKLRRLIAGNVPTDFAEPFLIHCKSLLDGIIKAVTSLRTSLSKEGCALVQDLARTFGPGIDPLVELLMQTFIKLTAATKKIASQLANTTVDLIVGKTTYNARIMQHMWGACQDKNVQPRTYVTGWLKTIISKESHHKSHLEHSGGLDLMEKCIKKGLGDPNPGVREKMRGTYWAFAAVWPAKAEMIMDSLDSTAQKLLQKDVNNPNPTATTRAAPAARPGLGLSKSTIVTSSKPSLRDAMMAQKRALQVKTLPARPGSAMAAMSPARNTSGGNSTTSAPVSRTRAESSSKVHGGISAAPMRPAKRRPDVAPRPATAGPYSGRNNIDSSPPDTKPKTVTPKAISGSPRRTIPRSKPGYQPAHSASTLTSPSRSVVSRTTPVPSPRTTPAKAQTAPVGQLFSSPSRENEELSLVVPNIASLRSPLAKASPPPQSAAEVEPADLNGATAQEPPGTPSKSLQVYEDPFTEDQLTPRPPTNGSTERPVLEDRPINEDAANLALGQADTAEEAAPPSADKLSQNVRLLDSGIKRVRAQSLDVHGYRKLQSLIRDTKTLRSDEKFDSLLTGLFESLESSMEGAPAEKIQDVKAQILATIKLLLKKARDNFPPHVSRGLEALLAARALYDARTHIVSGLELLAEELVKIGDPATIAVSMIRRLEPMIDSTEPRSHRSLSMGLHILTRMMENHVQYTPTESELAGLTNLTSRCLESKESAVRMDAVHLCVELHGRVGEAAFWETMRGIKDDPKSLITYYVVKRQRETGGVGA